MKKLVGQIEALLQTDLLLRSWSALAIFCWIFGKGYLCVGQTTWAAGRDHLVWCSRYVIPHRLRSRRDWMPSGRQIMDSGTAAASLAQLSSLHEAASPISQRKVGACVSWTSMCSASSFWYSSLFETRALTCIVETLVRKHHKILNTSDRLSHQYRSAGRTSLPHTYRTIALFRWLKRCKANLLWPVPWHRSQVVWKHQSRSNLAIHWQAVT